MKQHRLFRLLLNTFGFIGIQLRPLILNNSISIINWLWNIVINLLTLYSLYDQKPMKVRLERLITSDQYLMYYFIKICGLFIFPGLYLSYIITYLIYGRLLIQYLKSSTFSSVRVSHKSIMIFISASSIPTYLLWLRKFLPYYTYNLRTLFAIELFILYRSVTWIFLYFIQLANLHVLKQIRQRYLNDDNEKQTAQLANAKKCQNCYLRRSRCAISASLAKIGKRIEPLRHTLKNQSSITKCRDLYEEMKELAELNNRLQRIFSILTTIHLIHTSVIITISLNDAAMTNFPLNLWYFSDVLFRIIFWFGLLSMNRKVLQNFNQIEGFMLRKLRKVRPTQTISSRKNSSPLKCAKVLKFKEINIYQQSFFILLFDVLRIDLKFLLDWICFIAGYATLIHQTHRIHI
uniref:Uncharacterized protein LOC113795158 n=1 Tax=Dermatophagoides pteronyssinus TaxID=6956 RepID=A0A6P6Y768_DERPT|nr:uncharacterized protein LOC113795158 [Dermatophagoides pteronyssinus]